MKTFWDTDKPETVEDALRLLRYGVVTKEIGSIEIDQVRTERRMDRCAELLRIEIEVLEEQIAELVESNKKLRRELASK